nr:reverse transcriptase domain-containing protein [Tanacetum cinerariifolium]
MSNPEQSAPSQPTPAVRNTHSHSRYTEALLESEDSRGGHWKSRSKRKKSSREEDDLSQPWVCEETDPFTPRIRYFDFPKTRMLSHIKTYDRSNARVWFDDLSPESIDSYDDLKKAFLENYLQQKKYIKDPIELHNIKQRDGESMEDFEWRYKLERKDVKGAPECMRISGFVHGIANPELIKQIFFPPLGEDEGAEGPMIIEAEIRGHCVHRIYYPFDWIQWRDNMANRANIIIIEDEEHSASAWMNFMVVRSHSPYNGIIGRLGVRKLQAVPSTAHGMLKILVEGGVITLKSSKLVPLECAMVSRPEETPSAAKPIIEEIVKVAINPEYPEQTVMIGSTLIEKGRNKLRGLLHRNFDIFAWKPADMTGVPRHIAGHHAYKGYHQIQMAKEDEEKSAFITSQGIFCYTKMPFGLRNDGATYQRLVDKAFNKHIGRNLEVYVDDLVIKSRTEDEIVKDIEKKFKTPREINMKLYPKKCTFGVEEGMLLGYKVNTKGLKVCLDKFDIVLSLPSPKHLKDVQNLNGKLASLNRFLAESAEKSSPFFKTLKNMHKV